MGGRSADEDVTDRFIDLRVYDNSTDPTFEKIKYFYNDDTGEFLKKRSSGRLMARYYPTSRGKYRVEFGGKDYRVGPRTTRAFMKIKSEY